MSRLHDGADDELTGRVGQVVTAIPGGSRPGEVRVDIRGGSEIFVAFSDSPVERFASVLVIEDLGGRSVRVVAC